MAGRVQSAGISPAEIVRILHRGRENARLGVNPKTWTDEGIADLRRAAADKPRVVAERIERLAGAIERAQNWPAHVARVASAQAARLQANG
jgi:hypothetical protein